MPAFPDSMSPTEEQRRALSQLLYRAFLEVRILGHEGKAEQAGDLADTFRKLPLLMWRPEFSIEFQRDCFAHYQKMYGIRGTPFDYVTELDKIAEIKESR